MGVGGREVCPELSPDAWSPAPSRGNPRTVPSFAAPGPNGGAKGSGGSADAYLPAIGKMSPGPEDPPGRPVSGPDFGWIWLDFWLIWRKIAVVSKCMLVKELG